MEDFLQANGRKKVIDDRQGTDGAGSEFERRRSLDIHPV